MNIGILGLKGHQIVALEGARQLGDCHLVAVADDDPKLLADFVKQQPLAKDAQPYADWRHLVEHSMLDVAVCCDANHVHADQIVALAERGIDIVSEKPLATTLDDLARIRQALAKSKSHLTMLLTMRHEAPYMAMREMIRAGKIGTVCQATAQKSYRLGDRPDWQKHRATLGGIIPYIGIHALDLMRWTTGLDYTHVAAFHGNNGTPEFGETEDHASLALRFENGGSASARLDYLRPGPAPTHGDDAIRVAGSHGVIEYRLGDKGIHLVTDNHGPQTIEIPPTPNLFVDFVHALREKRPYRIPAEDCTYITEVVLRARDAADHRQVVGLTGKASTASAK